MNDILGDSLDGNQPEQQSEDLMLLQLQQELADILDEVCEARGMTQTDLADLLDLPITEVQAMMRGQRDVTLRTLARLQSRLNTTIFTFASARPEPHSPHHPMVSGAMVHDGGSRAFRMGVKVGTLATLASFRMANAMGARSPKSTVHMTHGEGTTLVPLR